MHRRPQCTARLMGRHARPTYGGILLSMRSKKQTERRQFLVESSFVYPRRKEGNTKTQGEGKTEGDKTLRYLGVVNPNTPKEDVPLGAENFSDSPSIPSSFLLALALSSSILLLISHFSCSPLPLPARPQHSSPLFNLAQTIMLSASQSHPIVGSGASCRRNH
ncbi:hypothetical protein AVEN_102976-1 [Araneus ventricosus]|uniref:Uncharacterized protein n=1 Tax=Araneus ventricosus TaxID=182803 RepID=A0A4Y2BAK0_ARAVE|nr:hypothetical protein AVEN_102976-1 [Araneus ventricosus]